MPTARPHECRGAGGRGKAAARTATRMAATTVGTPARRPGLLLCLFKQAQQQGLEEEGVAEQDSTVTEKEVIKSVSLTL